MNITHTRVITFSPTQTSLRVATAVARAWQDLPNDTLDLTCRQLKSPIRLANDCLAIVSVPVYAGRVAPLALTRLKNVLGDATPAILIVTYGNRDYEDALVELRDVLTAQGFLPLAAGAFIGEHSYSRPGMPIAEGRPDAEDCAKAEAFGREARRKGESVGTLTPFFYQGQRPLPHRRHTHSPGTCLAGGRLHRLRHLHQFLPHHVHPHDR